MPVELIDGRGYRLRHIAPTSSWPSEGGTATLLGRTYGFTELPVSHLPDSADLVEGSYTTRLGDSGEFSLSFPNVAGSKGYWRDRFSANLALEFIEIYRDDVLEFVGSIQRVEVDRGVVTVSGADAWSLLRRAYERDRTWTASPRDVIEAYTQVPISLISDDFDGNSLDAAWSVVSLSGSPSVSVANGVARVTSSSAVRPGIQRTISFSSDSWRVVAAIAGYSANSGADYGINLRTSGTSEVIELIVLSGGNAQLYIDAGVTYSTQIALNPTLPPAPFTMQVERRGQFIFGFVNGQLVGVAPVPTTTITRLRIEAGGSTNTADIDRVYVDELQPFLARGSDLGDYVLPGDYPPGGLRGRYWNNADIQGRVDVASNPTREPYAERLDISMNTGSGLSIPVQPGNSGDYFSIRWSGAIYLRGDLGDYTIETTSVVDGVRVWIGKTAWGDQIIDDWTTASGTNSVTWDASDHGSVGGWYPIVIDYFCNTASPVFRLQFTPPASYTDPGGASITGSSKITVPSTSLSALGVYDNRIQGRPHFDVIQEVAGQFGYQLLCEPMSLESGEFPGRLVPRLRVGRDTDVVLEVEDEDRNEPIFSPGVTFDGSDQAVVLYGTGAGQADGAGSQVTSEVRDSSLVGSALFSLTTWVDKADISFDALLAAHLSAELALRSTPWEEVRGTPRGQEQLADDWPLTGTLSEMRWRPGDGLRIRVPDISVEDTEPRQLTQVTRAFAAEGRTGTQIGLRQRPRSASRSTRGLLSAALQSQRAYQRQKISLSSGLIEAAPGAGAFTGYAIMALLPQDQVVRATVRIVENSAATSLGIEINGTDRTSALGGGWSTKPVDIDVTGYCTQASTTDPRFYVRLQNNGGGATSINFFVFVEILR